MARDRSSTETHSVVQPSAGAASDNRPSPQQGQEKKREPITLKVETVSRYALLGLIMGTFKKVSPEDLDEDVDILVRNFDSDVDIVEEVNSLSEMFPNLKLSIYRVGERDVWK